MKQNVRDEQAPLSGVWPIVTTPFDGAGRLDVDGLGNVVEHIIGSGAHGLVYPAIASEFQTLSADERRTAVDHVIAVTDGRRPVVVGISSADDHTSPAALANHAATRAAAGVMLMPRPSDARDPGAIRDAFSAVAAACGLPIILQNAPGPLGPALSADAVRLIVEAVPSIQYVKEETQPCGQRITKLLRAMPSGLAGVFGGAGGRFVLDELARGAVGTMPACEFTALHVALYDRFAAGDRAEARRLFNALLPLLNFESVFRTPATKFILHRMGIIDSPRHRDDNPDLDDADRLELITILENMGARARINPPNILGLAADG
ncbi:MAG TPA: dihydrodipicolinate synthase family protein [Bauldia sp.]|nr:dihydrodipicolinate synthase family protein [Bauldia sp.]